MLCNEKHTLSEHMKVETVTNDDDVSAARKIKIVSRDDEANLVSSPSFCIL